MALKTKKNGSYTDAVGLFVKKSGTYASVAGLFVKQGGVYSNVLSTQVTVTSFPYTLQASDSGKTLILEPSAETTLTIPAGLGASFVCNFVMSSTAGKIWPVTFVESSTQVTGSGVVNGNTASGGVRISAANNMSNNILCGAGKTASLSANTADVLLLSGGFGRYQAFANRTGLADGSLAAAGVKQSGSYTYHEARIPVGLSIVGMKVGVPLVYGFLEQVPTAPSLEYAGAYHVSDSATPQQFKWGGASSGVFATGAGNYYALSDFLPLAAPIVGQGVTNPIEFGISLWQHVADTGSTTGTIAGKGKALREYYDYTTAQPATSNINRTNLPKTSWPVNPQNIQGTSFGAPQGMKPCLLIGVTDTGALILIGDSRSQPSNGDWPDIGGTVFAGDAESVWGNTGPTMNIAIASDGYSVFNGQSGSGAGRRSMLQFGQNVACHLGINDTAANTGANLMLRKDALLALPQMAGRKVWLSTLPPWASTSSDAYTTVNGQVIANAGYETARVQYNNLLRNHSTTPVAGIAGWVEVADILESSRDSGKWKVATNARTVTDLVVTSGSNIVTSATANFTPDDTGKWLRTYLQSSTVLFSAVMTYISATQVSLTLTLQPGVAANANASGVGGTAYIQAHQYVNPGDGIHGLQPAGRAIRQTTFTLPNVR